MFTPIVPQKGQKNKNRELTPAEVVAIMALLQRRDWGRRARQSASLRTRGGIQS